MYVCMYVYMYTRPNQQGLTPLLWAAHNRQAGICRVLLELGVDLYAKDRYGRQAVDLAEGDEKTLQVLSMWEIENPGT